MRRDLHEENRVAWNAATQAHNSHKRDQAAFLREGGSTLFPEELDLLGDVAGSRLLHLQCNAGQDTLSLAALGAIVAGVDISDEAIAFATSLSIDSGIPGRFIRADIFDYLDTTDDRYDVAFTSYGALTWLSDLRAWAAGIARVLDSGGRLVVMEFHPVMQMLDDWTPRISYFRAGPESWPSGIGDYVAMSGDLLAPSGYLPGVENFQNPNPSHEFQWPISDILTAILDARLRLETFREYPYSNGAKLFDNMRRDGRRRYPPEGKPAYPLMYGLTASKSR